MYEIGCKERDIILLGMDNNGETREREVSDEDVNEEEKEEKVEGERNLSKILGKWRFRKTNGNGKRLIEEVQQMAGRLQNLFLACQRKRSGLFMVHFMAESTASMTILFVIN